MKRTRSKSTELTVKKSTVADSQLYASLFPRVLSKAEKRQILIIETAIDCYSSLGLEATTYEKIANKCKTSRSLIIHYFPERNQMALAIFGYIRARMQQFAVDAIRDAHSPKDQLGSYVKSVFDWTREYPKHYRVWLLIYYSAAIHPEVNSLHTELVSMGHQRIQVLVSQLRTSGKLESIKLDAKTIQILITGALVSLSSEDGSVTYDELLEQTIAQCLKIAKGP